MRQFFLVGAALLLQGALGSAIPQVVLGLGDSCCEPLAHALPGKVATRLGNSTRYDGINNNRWSSTTILSPSCIVRPETAADVARAVKILKCGRCKFAIKSGGHMANPGANNIDRGVSLDLGAFNGVVVAPDQRSVRLGAGSSWNNVYKQLIGTGVMVPGGLCGGTGVGGVTLGGGESLFQPRVGWVADNVLNFEVVLASGEVVNANDTSHADLFRALKGGSSNFGIVTHVDLKAFPHDQIWGGELILPAAPQIVSQTLELVANFTEQNNHYLDAGVQIGIVNLANGLGFVDIALAETSGCENPDILKPFFGLSPNIGNTVKKRTMFDLIEEIELLQPPGYRELVATVTFVNDFQTMQRVQAVNDAIYRSVNASVTELDWIVFYVPQPRVMQTYSQSCTSGGNSLGLKDLGHDQIVAFIMPRWREAEDDAVMNAAARAWVDGVEEVTRSEGTADPWLYVNFAGSFQKPLCSYGQEQLEFLQDVANKYDPGALFQRLVPGGFKLGEACSTC